MTGVQTCALPIWHLVRSQYLMGRGVPCLIAIHQDPSQNTKDVALKAYAGAVPAASPPSIFPTPQADWLPARGIQMGETMGFSAK